MGKPLLVWTVQAALNSGVFDRVFVSTDSEKYAEIARQAGAWVPFLRDKFADDFSTLAMVVNHEIKRIEEYTKDRFDNVSSLQVTCPLRDARDIQEVYRFFEENDYDSVLTCFKFGFMNPWWAFSMNEDKTASFLNSSPAKSRSQDNSDLYCPSGAIAISKINRTGKAYTTHYYAMPWQKMIDIDNAEDIQMAEVIYKMKEEKK